MIIICPCCDERFDEQFVCEICGLTVPGIPGATNVVRLGDGSIDDIFLFCQECIYEYDDKGF